MDRSASPRPMTTIAYAVADRFQRSVRRSSALFATIDNGMPALLHDTQEPALSSDKVALFRFAYRHQRFAAVLGKQVFEVANSPLQAVIERHGRFPTE
jgi:hypothetical protein